MNWTASALSDLMSIRAYIGQFNPTAALRFATRLVTIADHLSDHAERGRVIGDGRRQLAVTPPYLIQYRIDGDVVHILRIRHGAQQGD